MDGHRHHAHHAHLTILTILTINFTIEAVHDLPAPTPALWFHLAAAIGSAYVFIQYLRIAVRSYQQRQDRSR